MRSAGATRETAPVRRIFGMLTAVAVLTGAAACSSSKKSSAPHSSDARQLEYLEVATQSFDPGSALSVLAHFERAARDPKFRFDTAAITPEAFASVLKRIDDFDDTTDFDVLYLLNLWYAYGD